MDPSVRSLLFRAAVSSIYASEQGYTRRGIARNLIQRHGLAGSVTQGQVENIVRQAEGAVSTALLMADRPTDAFSRSDHGFDPSCQQAGGGFCYRALLTVTDMDGNAVSTAFTVRSDVPLSHADVAADALSQFQNQNFIGESPRARELARRASANIEFTLLSAGKGQ